MISREQALKLRHNDEIHFTGRHACTRTVGPRGGVTINVTRVRPTGRIQTWKTRPADFAVGVVHGMREYGEINQHNADNWHLAEDCPLNA